MFTAQQRCWWPIGTAHQPPLPSVAVLSWVSPSYTDTCHDPVRDCRRKMYLGELQRTPRNLWRSLEVAAAPLGSLEHLDGERGNMLRKIKRIIYAALQSHSLSLPSCPFIRRDLQSADLALSCVYAPREHKKESKLSPLSCFTGHVHQLPWMRVIRYIQTRQK